MGKSLRAKCKLRVRSLRRDKAAPEAAAVLARKVAVAEAAGAQEKVVAFNAKPASELAAERMGEGDERRGRSRVKKTCGGVDKETGLKTAKHGWYSLYPQEEKKPAAGGADGVEGMDTDEKPKKKKAGKKRGEGDDKKSPFAAITKISKRLPVRACAWARPRARAGVPTHAFACPASACLLSAGVLTRRWDAAPHSSILARRRGGNSSSRAEHQRVAARVLYHRSPEQSCDHTTHPTIRCPDPRPGLNPCNIAPRTRLVATDGRPLSRRAQRGRRRLP